MKKALLTLLFVIFSLIGKADCGASGISAFPESNVINKNSLILIEGYYSDQENVRNIGDKVSAKLVSKSGSIELVPIKTYEGMMHLTMVVLQPATPLIDGETYTLEIKNGGKDLSPDKYDEVVNDWIPIKWTVKSDIDKTDPTWKSKPVFDKLSYIAFGCGPGEYGIFNAEVTDESEVYVEVEFSKKGTEGVDAYLIPVKDGIISVGHGMCSGGFTFGRNEEDDFQVRFRLYDICGNQVDNFTNWYSFKHPLNANEW